MRHDWNPRTERHPDPDRAWVGPDHWHAAAPQSWVDVKPFEDELRRMDDRLRIHWNPRAVPVFGQLTDVKGRRAVVGHDGRWEVILVGSDKAHFRTQSVRDYTLVCRVTKPTEVTQGGMKVPAMVEHGPYAPIGAWLVTFLRLADRHNVESARKLSQTLDAMQAAREAAMEAEAMAHQQENAEREYHRGTKEGGGVSELHPVTIELAKSA